MKQIASKLLFSTLTLTLLQLPATVSVADDPFAEMDAEFSQQQKSTRQQRSEFELFKQQQRRSFENYKKKLAEEFAEFKKIAQQETRRYQAEIKQVWDQPELSSRKTWVEYSSDLKQRNKVDFEKQQITISRVEEGAGKRGDKSNDGSEKQQLRQSLKKLITKNKAEAFKDDKLSQAIENKSKQKIDLLKTAKVKPKPILVPYLTGKPSLTDAEIDALVDQMIKRSHKKVSRNKQGKRVVSLEVPMDVVPEKSPYSSPLGKKATAKRKPKPMADLRLHKLPRPARMIQDDVSHYAGKSDLNPSLVFAVIETESAFNPMARSPVPAYGLMQIVPSSAGQDATAQLFGKAKILSPSYLYNSDKNIEVGTTYLNILYYRYLKAIKNPKSRLYCAIAAYNTGAGNVAKAFIGKRRLRPAVAKINRLSPQQVYDHLLQNLPYEETRKYLVKVSQRMAKYEAANEEPVR